MAEQHPQTFLDHLLELRRRLFAVLAVVLVGGGVGWYVQEQIVELLLKPINHQTLIYTSPGGGFDFLFKISLFTGVLLAVPVMLYQLVRFLEPVIAKRRLRSIILLLSSSVLLVVGGVGFAYFVSLPAAMHFLTQFSNDQIQALLTTNEYMNFVMIYLAAFAILFQIPLFLLFINTITPLKPGKLLKQQRAVILLSFIGAALITPTPDPMNQLLLAGPIILLYQVGIGLVWVANRRRKLPKTGPDYPKEELLDFFDKVESAPSELGRVPMPALKPMPVPRPPVAAIAPPAPAKTVPPVALAKEQPAPVPAAAVPKPATKTVKAAPSPKPQLVAPMASALDLRQTPLGQEIKNNPKPVLAKHERIQTEGPTKPLIHSRSFGSRIVAPKVSQFVATPEPHPAPTVPVAPVEFEVTEDKVLDLSELRPTFDDSKSPYKLDLRHT